MYGILKYKEDEYFLHDCTCAIDIFRARYLHHTTHGVFWHHHVKMLPKQTISCESFKNVEFVITSNSKLCINTFQLLIYRYYFCNIN